MEETINEKKYRKAKAGGKQALCSANNAGKEVQNFGEIRDPDMTEFYRIQISGD
jgi:hypothetical protein